MTDPSLHPQVASAPASASAALLSESAPASRVCNMQRVHPQVVGRHGEPKIGSQGAAYTPQTTSHRRSPPKKSSCIRTKRDKRATTQAIMFFVCYCMQGSVLCTGLTRRIRPVSHDTANKPFLHHGLRCKSSNSSEAASNKPTPGTNQQLVSKALGAAKAAGSDVEAAGKPTIWMQQVRFNRRVASPIWPII
jgi:hypothetical protein